MAVPFQTQHTNTSHFQDGGLRTTIFLEFPESTQMCHKSLSWSSDMGFCLISDIWRRWYNYPSRVPLIFTTDSRNPGYIHTPPLTSGLWAYISQLSPLCGSSSSKKTSPPNILAYRELPTYHLLPGDTQFWWILRGQMSLPCDSHVVPLRSVPAPLAGSQELFPSCTQISIAETKCQGIQPATDGTRRAPRISEIGFWI